MNWLNLIQKLPIPGLPALANAGKGIGEVVDVVRTITGARDPAEADAILADPEKMAELKIQLAEVATERLRIVTADVADARRNAPRDKLRSVTGIVSAVSMIGMLALVAISVLTGHPIHETPIVMLVCGSVLTSWTQLQSFYFGTSESSEGQK